MKKLTKFFENIKLKNLMKRRPKGDPRVNTGEAMPETSKNPSWFHSFVEELNKSPLFKD